MINCIDLNADLGEGCGFDRELLMLVSSANISCGAHAGSEADIRAAINNAIKQGVNIGAHPSYPDREHWGRRSLFMTADSLYASLMSQLQWLDAEVRAAGGKLHHVKPHGALYNDAARDPALADLIAFCVKEFDPTLSLCGLAGGAMIPAARDAGLSVLAEAFADRHYQSDGTLVPRAHANAMIEQMDTALAQALAIIHGHPFAALDGTPVTVAADTLCIHGDGPNALAFAQQLCSALKRADIRVRANNRAGAGD